MERLDTIERKRRAAYHEAGHAVVGHALGLPIGEIPLAHGDGGCQIGHSHHLPVVEQMTICYAGLAGGNLSRDLPEVGEGERDVQMAKLIMLAEPGADRSPAVRKLLQSQAHSLAVQLVRKHQDLIARLAERLVERDLNAADVAEMLDPLCQSAGLPREQDARAKTQVRLLAPALPNASDKVQRIRVGNAEPLAAYDTTTQLGLGRLVRLVSKEMLHVRLQP